MILEETHTGLWTIALVTLYFIGMLVCQFHIMLKSHETDKWEVFYMVLSLFSWAGWLVFLMTLKIRQWKS